MDEDKRMYVLRVRGDSTDNCKTCIDWEEMVNSQGGIVFGEEDIRKASNPYMGRTNLFHTHCRCRLIPTAGGQPITDDVDRSVVFSGALGHAYYSKLPQEDRVRMMVNHDV